MNDFKTHLINEILVYIEHKKGKISANEKQSILQNIEQKYISSLNENEKEMINKRNRIFILSLMLVNLLLKEHILDCIALIQNELIKTYNQTDIDMISAILNGLLPENNNTELLIQTIYQQINQ